MLILQSPFIKSVISDTLSESTAEITEENLSYQNY